jgi:phage-related protein (TIGR01555 family)
VSDNALVNDLKEFQNSLGGLVDSIYNFGQTRGDANGVQLSQIDTLYINNRWYLISNYRQLLSQIYVEHGIIQTLVDQPVDDGFRAGFEIKSSQLDANDIEKILIYCERHRVIDSIMQGVKWGRLFGGGGILIITNENPRTPFDIRRLNDRTPLEIRPVDMWELYSDRQNIEGRTMLETDEGDVLDDGSDEFYDYYGHKIHHTRVHRITGKAPPSFIRPRLRGWGMSEVEKVVRSLNQYMKNQDVVFDLLDEAKIDVYKIKGFNSALATANGTRRVSERIQHANVLKNYNHALTMDAEDDYIQKQVTFSGLAEVLVQIRQGIAADLKMPMTKLFGISSAGFSSGEDDIENYNSMIESEVRAKTKFLVVDMLQIVCQKLFGFVPDDLMIEFNPLRILNAKEEEEVKNHQFNRVMSSYQSGLIDALETKEAINKDWLLPIEVDESKDALPPLGQDFVTPQGDKVEG